MSFADKLLSFDGRLRRRDWWLLSILLIVVSIGISQAAVFFAVGPDHLMFAKGGDPLEKVTNITSVTIQCIISLLFIWPSLALGIKRAHDRDAGAMSVIVLVVVSRVLSIGMALYNAMTVTAMEQMASPVRWAPSIVALLIGLYFIVVMGFLDGTPEENRFGPSPKDPV